jgi:hypothetical protein
MPSLRFTEPVSGLDAVATLLTDQAPANVAWLMHATAGGIDVSAIHAMWTGPEISAPIPATSLPAELAAEQLPLEHATIMPQPGEVVLTWLPPRVWGGGKLPVFDVGLYYGPGARCFFPIGWQPGSVVARVADVAALAEACGRIRRNGACTLRIAWQP